MANTGNHTLHENESVYADTIVSSAITATGAITLSSAVTMTGAVTMSGTNVLSGTNTLSGATTLSSAATLSGTVSMTSGVTMSGAVSMTSAVAMSGAVTASSAVTMSGANTLSGTNTLSGATAISSAVTTPVGNASTGSTIPIYGLTILTEGSGQNVAYTLPAPVAGQRKVLHATGGSTGHNVTLFTGTFSTTVGTTASKATFTAVGQTLVLEGLSTALWAVVSNNGAVLST